MKGFVGMGELGSSSFKRSHIVFHSIVGLHFVLKLFPFGRAVERNALDLL